MLQDWGYCSGARRESYSVSSCCSRTPRGHTLLATGLEQGLHPHFPVSTHLSLSESSKSPVGPRALLRVWRHGQGRLSLGLGGLSRNCIVFCPSESVLPGFLTRELATNNDY